MWAKHVAMVSWSLCLCVSGLAFWITCRPPTGLVVCPQHVPDLISSVFTLTVSHPPRPCAHSLPWALCFAFSFHFPLPECPSPGPPLPTAPHPPRFLLTFHGVCESLSLVTETPGAAQPAPPATASRLAYFPSRPLPSLGSFSSDLWVLFPSEMSAPRGQGLGFFPAALSARPGMLSTNPCC